MSQSGRFKGSVACDLVFPHNYTSVLPKCVLRIDNDVYDVTAWRHKHPGGEQLLDLFHGKDATDAFYALHSKDAIAQLKRIPKRPAKSEDDIPQDKLTRDFQELRKRRAGSNETGSQS